MHQVPDEIAAELQRLADAGGTLQTTDGEYHEAERLDLVRITPEGGGMGYTQIVELTNAGRRLLGLPVVTPAARKGMAEKAGALIAAFRGLLGRARS